MSLTRGRVFAGDYQVLGDKPLSEGGMGAVYVVEQLSTGKRRALKLMHAPLVADDKLRERFVREARVGGSIDSAHVVDVLSAGIDEESGMPWLVMELLEGMDLAARVDAIGALEPEGALEVLEQLCHAVGAAHRAGIVHRDLKPENIFLARSKEASARSVVKVLDFGIAKVVAEAITKRTGAMGTPLWMAPEQTETGTVDATADVWAIGLIAFYVLTGRCFWKTGNRDEISIPQIMREVIFDPIPPASVRAAELGASQKLPVGFDAWFVRCVTRERADRFANADLAFEAVSGVLGGPTGSSPTVEMPAPRTVPRPPVAPSPPLPVTVPYATPPVGVRALGTDRTMLADASASAPPRPMTSAHPPTPPPNELPARPTGRSPLALVLTLAALALLAAVGLFVSRAVSRRSAAQPPADAADAEGLGASSASDPSADPNVTPVPTLSVAAAPPPSHRAAPAASARLGAGVDPLLGPRGDAPLLPVIPVANAAFLNLQCAFPAKVSLDGKPLGLAPRMGVSIAPGNHVIDFLILAEPPTPVRRTVTLKAGETKVVGCRALAVPTPNGPTRD